MSGPPAPALVPQPEQHKEIPEPTQAYRDARVIYIFAAGLLASWELIGISLTAKENWGFEVESSSKGVLLVCLILVIFLGYIMNIQWMRCNPESRKRAAPNRAPRAAHRIALIAIAIAIIQYRLHNQIAAYIAGHQRQALVVAAIVAFTLAVGGAAETLAVAATNPKILKWLLILMIVLAATYALQAVEHRSYSLLFATFPGTIYAWVLYHSRWKPKATNA